MKIIGVTGPSGAGKSLFGECAMSFGIEVIDADKVYHSLLVPPSECLDELRKAFGDGIFTPSGELSREALGKIVFSDPEKLSLLNGTVLKVVLEKIRGMISQFQRNGASCVIVDGPTLIESGFHKECDAVISVLASKETRLNRIIARDNISRERAEARIKAQNPDSFYVDASNHIINNDGDREDFFRKAELLLKDLMK